MLLHEVLRQAREQAGFSQAELAKRAGIPRNQIVRAEKGGNITVDTLRKIAANLPITELPLLHTVKLTTDVLPLHDKVYLGAMETVVSLLPALETAVQHALQTWTAFADIRRHETPEDQSKRGPEADPTLLLQQIVRSVQDLRKSA
ncbi:MAG TPA: helix-turn-helix transcriptional regulator [Thermoanaerobaculia bacterium]|nr:helix-turn-helix transcriptional regulator [Thermoanaerobaculia bacterium]